MNNLITRKIVLGMLMALVLAFSVQGIADALTFTARSSETQSARMGSTFNIGLTVNLTGDRVQNHPEYSNRRVNAGDHDDPYQYIDNDGYERFYIRETSTSYRTLSTQPTAPAGTAFVVDPRPEYSTNSDGTAANPAEAGLPTTPLLVNTSGRLYDSAGNAVYIQSGNGTREVRDSDNEVTTEANRWRYINATGYSGSTKEVVALKSARHDFNNEAIAITITRTNAPSGVTAAGTLKLQNPNYVFETMADGSATADYTNESALQEGVGLLGLPGTLNLVL